MDLAIIGIIGGLIFFLSWILQAYETKKNNKPVFSRMFFMLRLVGSILLIVESIRVASLGLIIVNVGTAAVMVYNIIKI